MSVLATAWLLAQAVRLRKKASFLSVARITQRRIVNVADGNIGENSIDAVNGSQLYAVREGAVSYGTKMEEDLWGQ